MTILHLFQLFIGWMIYKRVKLGAKMFVKHVAKLHLFCATVRGEVLCDPGLICFVNDTLFQV